MLSKISAVRWRVPFLQRSLPVCSLPVFLLSIFSKAAFFIIAVQASAVGQTLPEAVNTATAGLKTVNDVIIPSNPTVSFKKCVMTIKGTFDARWSIVSSNAVGQTAEVEINFNRLIANSVSYVPHYKTAIIVDGYEIDVRGDDAVVTNGLTMDEMVFGDNKIEKDWDGLALTYWDYTQEKADAVNALLKTCSR